MHNMQGCIELTNCLLQNQQDWVHWMWSVLIQKGWSWIHLKLIFPVLSLLSFRYCRFHTPPPLMSTNPQAGQRLLFFEALRSYSFRRTTLGRTPLEEWSALHKDVYLTSHNTHARNTPKSPEGFAPAIPPSERLQTHALDCVATGIASIGDWTFLVARAKLSQVSGRSLHELPTTLLQSNLYLSQKSHNLSCDSFFTSKSGFIGTVPKRYFKIPKCFTFPQNRITTARTLKILLHSIQSTCESI
jgi:hypothetical protein